MPARRRRKLDGGLSTPRTSGTGRQGAHGEEYMFMPLRQRLTLSAVVATCMIAFGAHAASAAAYTPITPSDAGQTYTLNGRNLTVAKLVDIARYGAKVQLSPQARQRSLNAYYLVLEGSREGIPIYWFNRAPGAGRQDVIFQGDPLSTDVTSASPTCPQTGSPCSNRDYLLQSGLKTFQSGTQAGVGSRGEQRGDRARDDGRARQHDVLRGGDAPAHPDADRLAQPRCHAGDRVSRLPGRG